MNTSLGVYSPLNEVCAEMTFRHGGERTRVSALSYAIMHKGEEDALWLLRNGVFPDFGNGNLHRIIQQRMYGALAYYRHALTELFSEMRYDEISQIINERVCNACVRLMKHI